MLFITWSEIPALWLGAGLALALLLGGIWRAGLWLRIAWLNRQLDRQFDRDAGREALRFYQPAGFGHSRPDFPGFQLAETGIVPWFRKSVFRGPHPLHTHYIVFGPPGAGKTTLIIRLWRVARLDGLRGGMRPRLFRLADPQLFEKLEALSAGRDKTLLLLDGLDEILPDSPSYKLQLDRLFDHIQGFARVVITCRSGALPFALEAGNRDGLMEYIGERHFQVFVRLFLAPFDEENALQFMEKRVPAWQRHRRRSLREMIREMPELMGNPLLLRLVLSLTAGKRRFRFKYELLETYLLSWIASQSPASMGAEYPRHIWDFLMETSRVGIGIEPGGTESGLAQEALALRAAHYGLAWRKLQTRAIFTTGPDKTLRFRHPYLHAPLIAYAVFNDGLPEEALNHLSEAKELFREHAWEKYLRQGGTNMAVSVRTRAHPEKRPAHALHLHDLPMITHLYLPRIAEDDLRFIRCLDALEAIWLEDKTADPASLLPFLPHGQLRIYWHANEGPIAFEPLPHGRSVRRIDPEAEHPFGQSIGSKSEATREPGSQALLSLFSWNLLSLPDPHCRLRSREGEKQFYECFPGTNELDMFDKAWVCELPGDEVNVMFEYQRPPTLLIQGLEEIVKKLVRIYGEDDGHRTGFTDADRAGVEDGCWTGRHWFWGNTDRYAYPVQLFMTRPGAVKLIVYGLPAARTPQEQEEEAYEVSD